MINWLELGDAWELIVEKIAIVGDEVDLSPSQKKKKIVTTAGLKRLILLCSTCKEFRLFAEPLLRVMRLSLDFSDFGGKGMTEALEWMDKHDMGTIVQALSLSGGAATLAMATLARNWKKQFSQDAEDAQSGGDQQQQQQQQQLPTITPPSIPTPLASTALERLIIHSRQLTEDAICAALPFLSNLTHLELRHCSRLTDRTAISIAEHCPKLRILYATAWRGLSDIGIERIALRCPNLTEIVLDGSTAITNNAIGVRGGYRREEGGGGWERV